MSREDCPIHPENPDAEWRSLKPGTVVEFDSEVFNEEGKENEYKKYDGLKGIIVRPLGCHEDLAGIYDYVISWDWKDTRYVQFKLDFCRDPVSVKNNTISISDVKAMLDPRISEQLIRVSKNQ